MQLTTDDGHKAYLEAVEEALGCDVNFAQMVKIYGNEGQSKNDSRRYSPSEFSGSEKRIITGDPDMKKISTSYVERQNLRIPRSFGHLVHGDPEPNYAYEHAPLYSPDKRIQQEAGKPHARDQPVFHALQFCAHSQVAESYSSDGSRDQ